MIPALCIAGLASSVGKTTVTVAMAAAFRRRGLRVRCAKVGPDYIDPGFHAGATGAPSRSLDGWMLPARELRTAFARAGHGADLVLVEGAMGLFDGLDGASEVGSTAAVAKALGVPLLLVVDAGGLARSAAALVLGAETYEPGLSLAGVVMNRVGGERHARWLAEAVTSRCRTPVLGAVPWQRDVVLPERHLGLVTARELGSSPGLTATWAELAESTIDLDRCLRLARSEVVATAPPPRGPVRVRLAIAEDDAFQFYYPDALEALEAAGAQLVRWSPLADRRLPEADALYLGGGYPEVHAARLAANREAREAVRHFAMAGRPVHAECGGLIYLSESTEDPEGADHPMASVLPVRCRMKPERLTIGYREARLLSAGPLGPAGAVLRGHEFHRVHVDPPPAPLPPAYSLSDPTTGTRWEEGFRRLGTTASFVHLHLGSRPGSAEAFVAWCAAAAGRRGPSREDAG